MGILIILKDNVKDSLMISPANKVDDRMITMMAISVRIIFEVAEAEDVDVDVVMAEVNGMIRILIDHSLKTFTTIGVQDSRDLKEEDKDFLIWVPRDMFPNIKILLFLRAIIICNPAHSSCFLTINTTTL